MEHRECYENLIKDTVELRSAYTFFSAQNGASFRQVKTTLDKISDDTEDFADDEPLTPEMNEKILKDLRGIHASAMSVLEGHRKVFKSINKAIKNAEKMSNEDYDHLHMPFITCATALNLSEQERMAMLDPLIADHFLKLGFSEAFANLQFESLQKFSVGDMSHFDEIKTLLDCLRQEDFKSVEVWLDSQEVSYAPESSSTVICELPLPLIKKSHLHCPLTEKKQRIKFLLAKMQFIIRLFAKNEMEAAGSHNYRLINAAQHLLKFHPDYPAEVQHMIGALTLAQNPSLYQHTAYFDLAATQLDHYNPADNINETDAAFLQEELELMMELEGDLEPDSDGDYNERVAAHRNTPSYRESLIETCALISECVCWVRDQPPFDSLEKLVHLGLRVMPDVHDKRHLVAFHMTKPNTDVHDCPIRVTNHDHTVHNIFHCPLKKDLFNPESDCVALHCGHVISRDGFNGLKSTGRHIRSIDSERVTCPYCPISSHISRVRGIIF